MRIDGDYGFYAEIAPAASAWLPWPGRTSRWWFEVTGPPEANDEYQVPTHYYTFDGGAFTLRRCIFRAVDAVFDAEQKYHTNQVGESG